jgi:hypothetical protein
MESSVSHRFHFATDDEVAVVGGLNGTARRYTSDSRRHGAPVRIDSADFVCRRIGEQCRSISVEEEIVHTVWKSTCAILSPFFRSTVVPSSVETCARHASAARAGRQAC